MAEKDVLMQIKDLSVTYETRLGPVSAVEGVSFDILKGEILGLVGESGCGKSTMGKALMRMIQPPGRISSGKLIFDGEDIMTYDEKQMRDFRGRKISMIFQDPMTSLNPVQRVDEHLAEAIQVHEPKTKPGDALGRSNMLMERLGIQKQRMKNYPHQLSGGMRQRAMIAMALACNPKLIIGDEPTTALDVMVQAQILELIQRLRTELDLSFILISHDLSVMAETCDKGVVMYAGEVVESGTTADIFNNATHPYTRQLIKAFPNIHEKREMISSIKGDPPDLVNPPAGCGFCPRCDERIASCETDHPDLVEVERGHFVRCVHAKQGV